MTDFDVIVLGGGSAGSSAAAAAQDAGAETLMINDGELGGLCILRGCMPTKSMLAAAHAIHQARHLDPFGARLEGRVDVDFAKIAARKDGHVARFKKAKVDLIDSSGYTVLDAHARFVESGVVEAGGQRIRAKKFVLAVGSIPSKLAIPGLADVPVWTSDTVMRVTEAPKRLLVQGAGATGLELAQFFARVGTQVVLVNRSPLSKRIDAECGEELRNALLHEPNMRLAAPGRIERLVRAGDGLRATLATDAGGEKVEADALLMAVGRKAALEDLGLDTVGLASENGRLVYDDEMRTTNPDIYVAGDATGRLQVLHLANQEGRIAGCNAAGGGPLRMDYRLNMAVIFTDPPYAQVGLSERDARDAGLDIVVGRERFAETGRAIVMEVRYGLWKLVADRKSGEILGSSILGPRADDLIHQIATLMHYRGKVGDIFDLPWYHPTLSEVILNLARDIENQRA